MDPQELPNIFKEFYQAGNAESTRIEGTGVGLALVKALTEGHGGKVKVESALNLGSIFTVQLPAAPEEFQNIAKSPSVKKPVN
jgi:signal transduction histidine kinase